MMQTLQLGAAPCAANTFRSARRPAVAAAVPPSCRRAPAPALRRVSLASGARRGVTLRVRAAAWTDDVGASSDTGRVRAVECTDWKALEAAGWVMLDVRPPEEVERVAVKGSVNVPLFVNDDDTSFSTLLKQAAAYGTGGWWMGGGHMKMNPTFIGDVQAKVPKDKPVVLACQKGLRSLSAAEQLVRAGYPTVAWLNGGYDAATKADFNTSNDKDMRYGGVAGLAGLIGWTKVQQQEQVSMGGGVFNVLKYVALFAVVQYISIAWQFLQVKPPGTE